MHKFFSVRETQDIERRAIEEFGIPGLLLMEHAAKGLAKYADSMIPDGPIAILCGKGNNGGDGMAAARHLFNRGRDVGVLLVSEPDYLKPDSRTNYEMLIRHDIAVRVLPSERAPQLCADVFQHATGIIDALFGIGLSRPLTGVWKALVETVNASGKMIISADVPSGLNADTGEVLGVAVKAAGTAVFGTMKRGLIEGAGPELSGTLRLIDMGLPRVLIQEP